MSTVESLTPEQVDRLRRGWDRCEQYRAERRHNFCRTFEVAHRQQFERFVMDNMPSILASLEHHLQMLRRLTKSPAGPAPAEGENDRPVMYFNRPI